MKYPTIDEIMVVGANFLGIAEYEVLLVCLNKMAHNIENGTRAQPVISELMETIDGATPAKAFEKMHELYRSDNIVADEV